MKTGNGTTTALASEVVDTLRGQLRGALCLAGEPGYEQARSIWNAMIDRRPAVIVRAAGAADVIRAVGVAREQGLTLAVRGGGHNIAGNAVCDGGLMIDLSPMKSVRIDPIARTARVEPGVTLGDCFGWISRKHGLTVDNLLSVDVVTAKGELVHANEKENPDLFWAIRG